MQFWIDVETVSGSIGSGPIKTALNWESTIRLSRAGEFSTSIPASDPRTALIHPKRILRCYAIINSVRTLIGAGIVDKIQRNITADGILILEISGPDLLRELTYRSVGFARTLSVSTGAPIPVTDLLNAWLKGINVGAQLTPILIPGWNFTVPASQPLVYGQFAGELVLAALIAVVKFTSQNFYATADRILNWIDTFSTTNIRAIAPNDTVASETNINICYITNLVEVEQSNDLITRIYPYGSGNFQNRLTLGPTIRTAPTGYTLDKTNNFIVNNDRETSLGFIIERYYSYKQIVPISNSDIDIQRAADTLFDLSLKQLQDESQVQKNYRLSVTKLDQIIYPGQIIHVEYRGFADGYKYVDINEDLIILESTIKIDNNGLRTSNLQVSTTDQWPKDDFEEITGSIAQGSVMEAHPQLTLAYSPVGPYTRRISSQKNANFVVRVGSEVTALSYAILRFKTGPLISSVTAIAASEVETATSKGGGGINQTSVLNGSHSHTIVLHATIDTGGLLDLQYKPVTDELTILSSGGNQTFDSMDADDNHSHQITVSDHDHEVDIPAHNHQFSYGLFQDTLTPDTISVSINGIDRTTALNGPWATGGGSVEIELDITEYLATASGGLRQNHAIQFSCASDQGEIEVEIDMLVTIQAIAFTEQGIFQGLKFASYSPVTYKSAT